MSRALRFGSLFLGFLATCSVVNAPAEVEPFADGTCAAGMELCGDTCIDPLTSSSHCGGCGVACGQGTSCVAGACVCPDGAMKCDGVCVDAATDPRHCKMCGVVCPQVENADSVCGDTGCGYECAGGFDDCNTLADDGCEVDTTQDTAHCGGCNTPCPDVLNGTAGCQGSTCAIVGCDSGWDDCDDDIATGCETDLLTSPEHCGSCPNPCGVGVSCQGGVCLDSAPSCRDLQAARPGTVSGVYTLDADGGGPLPPFQAFCDMATDGGGWTLIVLTNGNVDGHPNVPFAAAKDNPSNVNGALSVDLDSYDFFMGTNFWNLVGPSAQMLWKVGNNQLAILDVVLANFNVYQAGERINWSGYTALLGGIPNINYQNDGFLQALDAAAPGIPFPCVEEMSAGVGLHGPWFYTDCSNASPWCTGHGDCNGLPIRMQWRNQDMFTTATAPNCSNHGEIYVR